VFTFVCPPFLQWPSPQKGLLQRAIQIIKDQAPKRNKLKITVSATERTIHPKVSARCPQAQLEWGFVLCLKQAAHPQIRTNDQVFQHIELASVFPPHQHVELFHSSWRE
jgi:hypothetical protein